MREFVKPEARNAINDDYPKVQRPGSFPLSERTFRPNFKALIDDLHSPAFRAAFERKFSINLTGRSTMITVRGRCSKEKDGKIHTDSKTKIITVLLYMNPTWESVGGRLRLLKSPNDIDDMKHRRSYSSSGTQRGEQLLFRRTNDGAPSPGTPVGNWLYEPEFDSCRALAFKAGKEPVQPKRISRDEPSPSQLLGRWGYPFPYRTKVQ